MTTKKTSILKFEREQRGWSQARVAEELNVSTRTIVRWEQGLLPYPHYRDQLCALYGKTAQELDLVSENEGDEEPELLSSAPSLPATFLFDPLIPEPPDSTNTLLGRDELLAQIKQRLLEGNHLALTAINGLPGIGKTSLALALATDQQVQARYSDGILWASLGPHPNVLNLLIRWGSLLGISADDVENPDSQQSWWRALHMAIGSQRMLLIIDDVWSPENALALKVGGNNCAHLVTTRSPQVAFAFAQQETLVIPELKETDGLALLARFVPQFVEQHAGMAREMVRKVGGLPLAVKLIGYYLALQMLPGQPGRLLRAIGALRNAQRRLEINMPSRWQEHRPSMPAGTSLSLQAVIALSDQHLSKQAHTMLCALTIFPAKPDSFSEEAALEVGQESVETLDELWDIGLLEASGPGRYMLHQTIVDYAHTQCQTPQIGPRLVHYTIRYLQAHEHDFKSIDLEVNTLLAGLDMAIKLEMYQELFLAITCFVPYLRARNHSALADPYLQIALKEALQQANVQASLVLLQLLAEFALMHKVYGLAESYIQQALELALAHEHKESINALRTMRDTIVLHNRDSVQAQANIEGEETGTL